jgi:hypothetical protein
LSCYERSAAIFSIARRRPENFARFVNSEVALLYQQGRNGQPPTVICSWGLGAAHEQTVRLREGGFVGRALHFGAQRAALVPPYPSGKSAAEGENTMYVTIRTYSGQGATELFDALAEREQDVQALISTVPGFISYQAFRTNGGGQTVTVAEDKAGTEESSRRAAEWVKENVGVAVNPPKLTEGSAILHF